MTELILVPVIASEPYFETVTWRIIVGVAGTIVGLILPYFFNDVIRPYLSSIRTIRERIKNDEPLNPKEEKRIQKYAIERLNQWIERFQSPSETKKTYDPDSKYVSLPYTSQNETTQCPSSNSYIYFDSTKFSGKDVHDINNNSITENFEKYLGQEYFGDTLGKKLFNLIKEPAPLKVWIRIPNYIVESKASLTYLYEKLGEVSKNWFPKSELTLELFLPRIYFPEIDNINLDEINDNTSFHFDAGKLVYYQDLAVSILSRKNIFGGLEIDLSKKIPANLLESRLQNYDSLGTNQLTKVFGEPGSGKTEILDYIIKNKVQPESNTLIICVNSHDSLSDLKTYNGKYDSFIHYIIELIDINEIFDVPENNIKLIKSVLSELLKSKKINLMLVIDNLENSESLYSDILDFLSSKNVVNVKFLLASRVFKQNNFHTIPAIEIKTERWTYDEALQIAFEWNESTASITNKPWLKSMPSFSTYLLRIISATNTDENIDLDELVKGEIEKILSPILKNISKTNLSADDQILKIKNLLENDFSKEAVSNVLSAKKELEIIRVFGNISLNKNYNYKRNTPNESNDQGIEFSPEKIVSWSEKMIPDTKTAKAFIESCKAGGVLTKASYLTDKLIQDGSAAITIQQQFISNYLVIQNSKNPDLDELNKIEGVVHNLITSLARKNSLEIFKLSFKVDHLIVIVNSIINSDREKNILKSFLSEDYILFLKRKDKNLEVLAYNLIQAFNKKSLSDQDKIDLATCLGRILKEDINLESYFNEMASNKKETELVSSVSALRYLDDPKVFSTFDTLTELGVLFDYCCLTWTEQAGDVLVSKLLEFSSSDNKLFHTTMDSFMKWVKRQEAQVLIDTIDRLLRSMIEKDSKEKGFLITITANILNYLYDNRISNNYKDKDALRVYLLEWKKILKKYTLEDVIETNELIKLVAYGINNEMCDRDSNYKIVKSRDKKTVYAICVNQFKKEGIQTIFSRFSDTENFELPSSKLLKYAYHTDHDKELVNDYLKANNRRYVPFPTLYPNEHKYFKDGEVFGMDNNDLNSTRFGWRAVFKL